MTHLTLYWICIEHQQQQKNKNISCDSLQKKKKLQRAVISLNCYLLGCWQIICACAGRVCCWMSCMVEIQLNSHAFVFPQRHLKRHNFYLYFKFPSLPSLGNFLKYFQKITNPFATVAAPHLLGVEISNWLFACLPCISTYKYQCCINIMSPWRTKINAVSPYWHCFGFG